MGESIVGLDLGQARDPSAIVVVEAVEYLPPPPPPPPPRRKCRALLGPQGMLDLPPPPPPPKPERRYHVRHSERVRLGTPYPLVVERVARILADLPGSWTLVLDATGVGRPVVDLFEAARIYPIAVTLTSGETATQDGARFKVPKRDLVTSLEVLLQERRLKIAEHAPGREALVDEMLNFRASVTSQGRDSFGADAASHDDLVIALTLACWYGRLGEKQPASRPTMGISQPWEDRDDPDALWLGNPEYRYLHGYHGGGSRFIGPAGSRGPRWLRFR